MVVRKGIQQIRSGCEVLTLKESGYWFLMRSSWLKGIKPCEPSAETIKKCGKSLKVVANYDQKVTGLVKICKKITFIGYTLFMIKNNGTTLIWVINFTYLYLNYFCLLKKKPYCINKVKFLLIRSKWK